MGLLIFFIGVCVVIALSAVATIRDSNKLGSLDVKLHYINVKHVEGMDEIYRTWAEVSANFGGSDGEWPQSDTYLKNILLRIETKAVQEALDGGFYGC